eukprot:scaffold722_cov255-Prasinococcus_capsulatus_cf.AAC.2
MSAAVVRRASGMARVASVPHSINEHERQHLTIPGIDSVQVLRPSTGVVDARRLQLNPGSRLIPVLPKQLNAPSTCAHLRWYVCLSISFRRTDSWPALAIAFFRCRAHLGSRNVPPLHSTALFVIAPMSTIDPGGPGVETNVSETFVSTR